MRNLYLKKNLTTNSEKFTFFDAQQNPLYRGLQTSMTLPPKFEITDCTASQQVISLTGSIFSLMPEFKLFDMTNNKHICAIKKKFTVSKAKVTIKTPSGDYQIDGNFVQRDFKIFDDQQREIISMHPGKISWGEISEIIIDTDLIAEHVAVGLLVGIECAYYSDNKY